MSLPSRGILLHSRRNCPPYTRQGCRISLAARFLIETLLGRYGLLYLPLGSRRRFTISKPEASGQINVDKVIAVDVFRFTRRFRCLTSGMAVAILRHSWCERLLSASLGRLSCHLGVFQVKARQERLTRRGACARRSQNLPDKEFPHWLPFTSFLS